MLVNNPTELDKGCLGITVSWKHHEEYLYQVTPEANTPRKTMTDEYIQSQFRVSDEYQILYIWTPWFTLVRHLALLFFDVLASFCVFVFCRTLK